ncbi:MAG: hypothetical protein H0U36_06475 [Nocardioidaceae bacterium]|nr:hypothetical protein [Nocardioidaceae bacterium]
MPRADVRVALVTSVATAYTSHVTVLDADSVAAGQLPVTDAVRDGVCFYVLARPGMLVGDFDRADATDAAQELTAFLRRFEFLPVLVASGQSGHRHVFCKVPAHLWPRARSRAHQLGADVRVSIRPPLTPHRQRLPVMLLHPTDPMQAVWALRGRLT